MFTLPTVPKDRDHQGGLAWTQAEKAWLQEQGVGWSPDHISPTLRGRQRGWESLREQECVVGGRGKVGMEAGNTKGK